MVLTTKGRYAINAIFEMAENFIDKPVSLSEISRRQNISLAYLEQIFANLKKAGLVDSVKGPGGGYVLLQEKITAFDIIKATGEKVKMTSCANDDNCVKIESNNNKCKTHHLWKGLERKIEEYFSSIIVFENRQSLSNQSVINQEAN